MTLDEIKKMSANKRVEFCVDTTKGLIVEISKGNHDVLPATLSMIILAVEAVYLKLILEKEEAHAQHNKH